MINKVNRFKLFNRYVELQSEMKVLNKELEVIKADMKKEIKGDGGFLECLDDGSGFEKYSRTNLVPDLDKLKKSLGTPQFNTITSRQFDWAKAEKAVYEGKLTEKELDKCMDKKVSIGLKIKYGKEGL